MNKTKTVIIASIAFCCLLLLGCAQTQNQNAPNASAAPSFAQAPTAQVSILDGSVEPATLNIAKGTVVVFTNNGELAHDVVFEDEESAALAPGESFSKLFSEAGEFNYACSLHYGLEKGVVKVA